MRAGRTRRGSRPRPLTRAVAALPASDARSRASIRATAGGANASQSAASPRRIVSAHAIDPVPAARQRPTAQTSVAETSSSMADQRARGARCGQSAPSRSSASGGMPQLGHARAAARRVAAPGGHDERARVVARERGRAAEEPASPVQSPASCSSASTTTLAPMTDVRSLGAVEARVEALDRAALPDVERLAGGHGGLIRRRKRCGRPGRGRPARGATAPPSSPAPRMAIVCIATVLYTSAPRQPMRWPMLEGKCAHRHRRLSRHRSRRLRRRCSPRARRRHQRHRSGAPATTRSAARSRLRPIRVASIAARCPHHARRCEARRLAVDRFGGLDILINNAAFGGLVDVASMDEADWQQRDRHEPDRRLRCCHEAIPHMKARGGGWIINISSLAREELVRRRRGVLRVEGRAERVRRGPDAGAAPRGHPRQHRHARVGADGVLAWGRRARHGVEAGA